MQAKITNFRKKERGIADILAVLIVIAITVVAGVALYSMVMGKVSVFGNSAGIEVETAEVTNNMLIITIKNTGSYTFSSVSYAVYSSGLSVLSGSFSLPSGGLAPSEAVSAVQQFSSSNPEIVGASYTIVITGTYNNGQTYTTSVTVVGS